MASAAPSGMVCVPRWLLRPVTVKLGSAELTLMPVSFNSGASSNAFGFESSRRRFT